MKYSREEIQQYIVGGGGQVYSHGLLRYLRQTEEYLHHGRRVRAGRMSMASPSTRRRCLGSVMWCIRICSSFRDPSTLTALPWRPEHGRVVRMLCARDAPGRYALRGRLPRAAAARRARTPRRQGITFAFGSEMEFYLFRRDENGEPTTAAPMTTPAIWTLRPRTRGRMCAVRSA